MDFKIITIHIIHVKDACATQRNLLGFHAATLWLEEVSAIADPARRSSTILNLLLIYGFLLVPRQLLCNASCCFNSNLKVNDLHIDSIPRSSEPLWLLQAQAHT